MKLTVFFIGVLIVLVGLSLLVSARIEEMRDKGEPIGPAGWAVLFEALADLWGQIMGSVAQEYRIGLTVLIIGVVVMVLPIAWPPFQRA